jgi:hypothetical protein
MFRPNQDCIIQKRGLNDVYGMPIPGISVKERCTIVKINIKNEKSSVRADTSASRGNAREFEDDAEFLLNKNTVAQIDDVILVDGLTFRIMTRFLRKNLQGVPDHVQITCTFWSAQ